MRKRFYGDTRAAQEYTRDAALLLAKVKGDMKFAGLAQGAREIELPNGVRIRAISRFGQDEVHVFAPPIVGVVAQPTALPATPGADYLWIGYRPTSQTLVWGTPLYALETISGLLIEPDGAHTLGGYAGDMYTRRLWQWEGGGIADADPFNYDKLAEYRAIYGESDVIDGGIVLRLGNGFTAFTQDQSYVAVAQPPGLEPLGLHYNDGSGGVLFSANGVVLYDSYHLWQCTGGYEYSPGTQTIPYDPKVPRTAAAFPSGQLSTWAQIAHMPNTYWHGVFVLDPHPSGLSAVDTQVHRHVKTALRNVYGRAVRVQAGEYILKLCATGPGRADTLDTPPGPVEVEIEVRIGKPVTTRFRTKVVIEWWSAHPRAILPSGSRTPSPPYDGSEIYGRPNPHGPMWWQGALRINVKERTAKQVSTLAPPGIFGAGNWDGVTLDVSPYGLWSNTILFNTYPLSTLGTLDAQAEAFAKTWYYYTWYYGDEGLDFYDVDWSKYGYEQVKQQILEYAANKGVTSLYESYVIFSGHPRDMGKRLNPSVYILEMNPYPPSPDPDDYDTNNYDRQAPNSPPPGPRQHLAWFVAA